MRTLLQHTLLLALPFLGPPVITQAADAGRVPPNGNTAGAQTSAAVSFGEIFVVNSTGDQGDASPGDGQCETAVGNSVCTLRAAIQEVDARNNGGDGISFSIPSTDPGCSNSVCDIALVQSLPAISVAVAISGPGANVLFIDGGGSPFGVRVFNVTTSGTVSISGVRITSGVAPSNQNGGGIQNVNAGTVNVTNCLITRNTAGAGGGTNHGGGGGIFNAGSGTVNVTNCTFEFNQATGLYFTLVAPGGAIYNKTGFINVTNTTFTSSNSTDSGGAIANEGGIVTVTGSTFHGNGAFNLGGAISSRGGTVNITNSTFYGNIVYGSEESGERGFGGAIANLSSSTLNLTNSTVTANFTGGIGGGVASDNSSGGVANVKSTIIALNYGARSRFGESPDVDGLFHSAGFNLIGKKDGSTGFTAATDKKGTIASPLNPKLDPKGLRDNGGPTQMVALVKGSPAIDKGTSNGLTGTLSTDQRGFARTVDKAVANASGGDGTDIGAYELQ